MRSMAYHEKKTHGTAEFPVEYHYVDPAHPQYVMPFHWHKEWELIRVKQGSFTVRADETEVRAGAGDAVLLRDGMLHGGTPEDCVYECLLFDLHGLFQSAEAVKKHLRPFYRMELLPPVLFRASEQPAVCRAAAALMDCCRPGPEGVEYEQLMILGRLCCLFGEILRSGLSAPGGEETGHRTHRIDSIKAALDLVEREYASPLTLEMLARSANMNANYFCRVFREVTHCTPMEYVLNYRLEQAAAALSAPGATVTAAAACCGFNDYSYFIRAFRTRMGVTPKQYQLRRLPRNAL